VLCYILSVQFVLFAQENSTNEGMAFVNKCAQRSVFLVSHRLNHPLSYSEINYQFGDRDYVSLEEVQQYLQNEGFFCLPKIYKKPRNLQYVASYLACENSSAILAIPLPDKDLYHFVMILSIHGDEMTLLDPKFAKVPISRIQEMNWPVLLVTRNQTTWFYWNWVIPVKNFLIVSLSSIWTSVMLVGIALYFVPLRRIYFVLVSCSGAVFHYFVRCRIAWVGLGIVIIIVALLVFLSTSSKTSRSILVFEPSTIDLGRAPMNSKIDIEFFVKNTSNRPIKIKGVNSSCDCFDMNIDSFTIPPLKNTKISASIKVSSLGKSTVQVLVEPESSSIPPALINIFSEGYASGKLIPEKSDLGVFPPNITSKRTLVLSVEDYDGSPIPYHGIEMFVGQWADKISVSLLRSEDAFLEMGASFEFEVMCHDIEANSVFEQKFTVLFGEGDAQRSFIIHVLGNTSQ
jgi:hypothetical protein